MRLICLFCLAACYQPNAATPCTLECTTSCPPGLECRDNRCVEPNGTCPTDAAILDAAPIDAPDAIVPLCPPQTTIISETPVIAPGAWFIAHGGSDPYAVRYTLPATNADVGIVSGTLGDVTDPSAYVTIVQDNAVMAFDAPRLSPDARELYLRARLTAAGTASLGRYTRLAGTDTWSGLSAQTFIGMTFTTADAPSPPTTTTPRRMIISRDSQGFIEVEETMAGKQWTVVRPQPAQSYLRADSVPVSFLGQAHLTNEGRRLVFRGQVAGQLFGAFYLERTSLAQDFAGPARQLPAAGSVSHPYFTSDCTTLFYTFETQNQVYRVTY
ncbi:MAG: hypothetical protein M4D80_08720 [Myxococcota bacterium]|nr:hypothetical protein [Deltaproteobacteria bacterium]MDQ3335232.1 hypothetical protein [Myxococcota bacterium]